MNPGIVALITAVVATPCGVYIGRKFLAGKLLKEEDNLKKRSQQLLEEAKEKAEILKKDKLLEARERFLQMKSAHENEVNNNFNTCGSFQCPDIPAFTTDYSSFDFFIFNWKY